MCNTPEHTFLLSTGQSTTKHFKAREAKYGKFAYSSTFGFSVPCGSNLEQIAPDSTIAVCFETGDDDWKVHWSPYNIKSEELNVGGETVSTLSSSWRPWRNQDVVVTTKLIPPVKQWPGWSQRVHRVAWMPASRDGPALRVVDSGFAASIQNPMDASTFERNPRAITTLAPGDQITEGYWNNGKSALIISESGASGVVDLTQDYGLNTEANVNSRTVIMRADPNT